MDKFINLIPNWAIGMGVLIISIGFIIAVMGAFVLLFKKNLSFSKGNITLTDEEEENNNKHVVTLVITPEKLLLAFDKIFETQFEIDRIEFRERLREQMMYAEDKIKEVKEKTIQIHRHLLISKGVSVSIVHTHPLLNTFEELIDNMLNQMKSNIRERFQEMISLFSYEDSLIIDFQRIKYSFKDYSERVIESLVSSAREFISKKWIENDIINRRESWKAMTEKIDEVGNIIKDVLESAINTQIKYNKKILKLKSEKDNYIKEVINS
jgi:hypothetical protein